MFDAGTWGTIGGIAILVGIIIQAFKGKLPNDWVPAIGLGLGIACGLVVYAATQQGWVPAAMLGAGVTGLLGGATAVGLYEAQKGTIGLAK